MELLYLGNNLLFPSSLVVTVENKDDCKEGLEKIEEYQRKKIEQKGKIKQQRTQQ